MAIGALQNVYARLGVKTVINCRGTWTFVSGSLEFPEVRQAQQEASEHFVNMLELQTVAVGRLSELTGAESGIVTSGSAGAMAAATAACMADSDDFPNTPQRGRSSESTPFLTRRFRSTPLPYAIWTAGRRFILQVFLQTDPLHRASSRMTPFHLQHVWD
jgi:hypothetical protein